MQYLLLRSREWDTSSIEKQNPQEGEGQSVLLKRYRKLWQTEQLELENKAQREAD